MSIYAGAVRKLREARSLWMSKNTDDTDGYNSGRKVSYDHALEILREEQDEIVADIRNKLTPFRTIIGILREMETGGIHPDVGEFLMREKETADKSLDYILKRLSGEIKTTTNI